MDNRVATWDDLLGELAQAYSTSQALGGAEAIGRLHGRGKLTARERLELLFDPGTFHEIGLLAEGLISVSGRAPRAVPADAVVTGWGRVDGRIVFAIADDGTIAAGARGVIGGRKAGFIRSLAQRTRHPLVQLLEASAGRMQDMMGSQFAGAAGASGGGASAGLTWASGRIPTVSAAMGFSFGGPSFQAPVTDFIMMTRETGFWGVGGPPVVRGGLGLEATPEEIGGAEVHSKKTGFADRVAADDSACIADIRRFLGYLPSSCYKYPPYVAPTDPIMRKNERLIEIVPFDHRKAYDVLDVIAEIVDDGEYFEMKPEYGRNIVTCFARLGGHPVGVIANQPKVNGGINDVRAGAKTNRFVQICDAYHIPLLFLQDQPGFMVGPKAEREDTVRAIARYQNTIFSVDLPIMTIILRKAYGYSYWLLGGKPVGADLIAAWPSAAISLAGPEVGVNTILEREAKSGQMSEERRQALYAGYREDSKALKAARGFRIDDVINPADTRRYLCENLEIVLAKRRSNPGPRRQIDA